VDGGVVCFCSRRTLLHCCNDSKCRSHSMEFHGWRRS